ncbi:MULTISPECIES: YbaB/EbfC family nucleoid-associated protein [unclassified Saccharothrix]|uniref:YbaB/EbfC family nucleoid-associated protein n=1 Tax=unclassified Saccharothrix TaxID=2593673 RepID=UPI00307E03BD
MDGDILDPDGARERLVAWKGRIDKLAADTQAMSERLSGVRVSAADPGGLAEVTVDSTGALVDLRFTDRIQRTAPEAVSRVVLATLAAARRQLADRSQEIIADTIGADSPAGRAIAERVGQQLRGGPAPERGGGEPDDDDGFDSRSYLKER